MQPAEAGGWLGADGEPVAGQGKCPDEREVEDFDTRLEIANAIFEYLEIWHNRKRRHSQLGRLTPIEFERNRIITVA